MLGHNIHLHFGKNLNYIINVYKVKLDTSKFYLGYGLQSVFRKIDLFYNELNFFVI
jgi:hypothetical protein